MEARTTRPGHEASARGSAGRPSRATPVAFFALVAAAIAAAGTFAYLASAADLRAREEREIATIAALKVREIVRWREERLADANAIAYHLAADLGAGTPAAHTLAHLREALRAHGEYPALALVGADGVPRLSTGESLPELSLPATRALVRRAVEERTSTLAPVRGGEGERALLLDAVAPLPGPRGDPAAIVLRVDPRRQLFATLQAWPRSSETSEALLVAADGGEAVILNELRDGTPAASVRIPAAGSRDPAARAALGARGVVEGVDHRGRRVLAAIVPVPDAPWALVAKTDAAEALGPLRWVGIWTAVVTIALVLASGAVGALWWHTQVDAFERAEVAAEAERRVLSRKLENLGRWTHDAVLVADTASRLVDANEGASRMFGYTREELVEMSVRDLRDPATLGDLEARLREQIARGAAMFETRYRRKDGTTFPAEVSVHVDEWEGHRYRQAIIRDVTAREAAAEALRASEAKFRAAFEFASLGIVIATPDGRIVETNRALRRMLGYGEDEARDLTLDRLHEPGDEISRRVLAQMKAGVHAVEMPRRFRRKDGSALEATVRATALRDDTGALRFALGVVEDVTEKRRLEARLVFADRMASIGTLAAGVAHEINNPLAFILTNLDFALGEMRADADPEVRRALQDAMDGAVRVREIVRDLRTFSRPGEDHREVLDPRRVLQSAVGLAAAEIRRRARLEVEAGDVPQVLASERRLAQALVNLLINAAQAIPEGRPEGNVIRAATSTAPDGRALLEVSDTGTGIAPEVLPRIFDPFFTTKPVGVGTGLGLSICHGIVTQLGGEIGVDSTPGQGSTFRVYLPAAPREAAEAQPAGAGLARGRVLVVDDEPMIGRAVARMLSPQHDVVARTSARAALELLATDRAFDVVVCDLLMPGMTGMELHASLAAVYPELARRTIFLTGGAVTDAAREFLERLPNPRLEKPVERGALRDAVARARAAPAASPAA